MNSAAAAAVCRLWRYTSVICLFLCLSECRKDVACRERVTHVQSFAASWIVRWPVQHQPGGVVPPRPSVGRLLSATDPRRSPKWRSTFDVQWWCPVAGRAPGQCRQCHSETASACDEHGVNSQWHWHLVLICGQSLHTSAVVKTKSHFPIISRSYSVVLKLANKIIFFVSVKDFYIISWY